MLPKGQTSLSGKWPGYNQAEKITAMSAAVATDGIVNGRISRRDTPGVPGALPPGSFGPIPVPPGNSGKVTIGTGGIPPAPPPPHEDTKIPFKPTRETRLARSGSVTPSDATITRKQVAGSSNHQATY